MMKMEYLKKSKRALSRYFFSTFYWDRGSDEDIIFVAGPGRSGTTWICSILAQVFNAREIFEPFFSLHLEADGIKDFFHHRYIPEWENKYNNHMEERISIHTGDIALDLIEAE